MAQSEEQRAVSPLAIALFGPFDVRLEGRSLPPPRSQKSQWLLALLALQGGRAVERAWLAATLWPESAKHRAAFNLRRNLMDLRHSLGSEARRLVAPTPHTLQLDLVEVEADVLVFDEAIASGDPSSLEKAVALHRGPLLQGCAEEWVLVERETREQAFLAALEVLAGHAMAGGDPAAAVHYLRRLTAADPLRDRAQRALMQALAAGGDLAAATQVYRDFRLLLHRELNAVPAPETTTLYEQIRASVRQRLAANPSVPIATPRTTAQAVPPPLPRPLTRLVGREQEARKIRECLAAEQLVTLTGPGGIGKTRLAIQVAEECRSDFADGVGFADLAGLVDPALVAQAVAAALGVREQPDCTLTVAIQEFLAPRQFLLVLDNCEHLVAACAELAETLLSGAPGLRLLATSRQPLAIAGENTWPVPPLSMPKENPSAGIHHSQPLPQPDPPVTPHLMEYSAVRLFVERARAVAPAFVLTEQNAATVLQICRRLDGIPLAIELAAARLRLLTVEQLAVRLDDRFRLLTISASRTAPPRQQTLRATMDWSYALLSGPERTLLRRLALFAGGFTLEAAEVVCAERVDSYQLTVDSRNRDPSSLSTVNCQLSTPEVLDLLGQLVDRSLVAVEEQGEAARYRLLETTRQYAAERLDEAGEAEQLRRRHRDWCLSIAEMSPSPREEQAWLQRLEAEHGNLRAALAWTVESDAEGALKLARSLCWFWCVRGYVTEGREWLRRILASGRTQDADPSVRLLRADVLQGAGLLAMKQGDNEAARDHYEAALDIFRAAEDQRGIAACLGLLSQIRIRQGDFTAAARLSEEALTIHRALGRRGKEVNDLDSLGQVATFLGDYASAVQRYGQSLEINRDLGDRLGEVYSLHNLGDVAQREGDSATAREWFEESLQIAREIDDRRGIANALRSLGQLAGDGGDTALARALLEESLALFRELNDRLNISLTLVRLGRVAAQEAAYGEARALLNESASDARVLRDRSRGWHRLATAETLEAFADLAVREGALPRAAQLYGAAEAIREGLGAPLPPAERTLYERHLGVLRAALHEEEYAARWASGRAMSPGQAITEALAPGSWSGR